MSKPRKTRILFITPLASRTGSEMMLWHVIKNIDRTKYEVAVASYSQGELLAELPADVKAYKIPGAFGMLDRISYHLGRHPITTALRDIQKDFNADLWYLNTIVLPKAALTAVALDVPFVVHFHEMPLSYVYVNQEEFDLIINKAKFIVGCSEATCEGIRQAGGRRVSLCYSFIEAKINPEEKSQTAAIRERFGIAPDDFVWVMSGVPSERKGFDLFPDIAEKLSDDKVHMIWVGGGEAPNGYTAWVKNRISGSASKTRIHLAGKQKEAYSQYLHVANGFLLTSRQDPFPLVMIEAAAVGKPIVSFPSGGVSELLEEGMGSVTEDISVTQLVTEMRKVMAGDKKIDKEVARKRVATFSIENGMREWHKMMDQISGS